MGRPRSSRWEVRTQRPPRCRTRRCRNCRWAPCRRRCWCCPAKRACERLAVRVDALLLCRVERRPVVAGSACEDAPSPGLRRVGARARRLRRGEDDLLAHDGQRKMFSVRLSVRPRCRAAACSDRGLAGWRRRGGRGPSSKPETPDRPAARSPRNRQTIGEAGADDDCGRRRERMVRDRRAFSTGCWVMTSESRWASSITDIGDDRAMERLLGPSRRRLLRYRLPYPLLGD